MYDLKMERQTNNAWSTRMPTLQERYVGSKS
jgi:hypothetical protein